MTQMLLVVLGLLVGAGVIVIVMWVFAGTMIRHRRDRDLDLISLRDEVDALEDENARLRAALDTANAVTRGRTRAAPTQIPLH
jgi:hypothetical protein